MAFSKENMTTVLEGLANALHEAAKDHAGPWHTHWRMKYHDTNRKRYDGTGFRFRDCIEIGNPKDPTGWIALEDS